jgi:hypothetical protein
MNVSRQARRVTVVAWRKARHRGWIGVRLDKAPDWPEIAELCEDAYRTVAPARLTEFLWNTGQMGE